MSPLTCQPLVMEHSAASRRPERGPPEVGASCFDSFCPSRGLVETLGSRVSEKGSVNTVRLLSDHEGDGSPFRFLLDNYLSRHEEATPPSGTVEVQCKSKGMPRAAEASTSGRSVPCLLQLPVGSSAHHKRNPDEVGPFCPSEAGDGGKTKEGDEEEGLQQPQQEAEKGTQRRNSNVEKRRLKDMRAQMKAIFKYQCTPRNQRQTATTPNSNSSNKYVPVMPAVLLLLRQLARESEGPFRPWSLGCLDRTALLEFVSDVPGLLGERLFQLFDSNGDDKISFNEFVGGLQAAYAPDTETRMKFLFNL